MHHGTPCSDRAAYQQKLQQRNRVSSVFTAPCVCVCWGALKARVFSGASRRRPQMLICKRRNSFSQRVLIELDVLTRARNERKNPSKNRNPGSLTRQTQTRRTIINTSRMRRDNHMCQTLQKRGISAHTHTHSQAHTHTDRPTLRPIHTQTLSLSLSLSLTHTHTHTD